MSRPEFFSLGASYQVAPGATASALLDDANCLVGIVKDSLAALAMSIDVSGESSDITNERGFCQLLYGLSYLAEMGNNAANAAHAAILRAETEVVS